MARKFAISFGLVNVPIELHPTVKEDTVHFNMITLKGNRVEQRLCDKETGEEVRRGDTLKGYEVTKGNYVIFSKDEVERVKLVSAKSIEIIGFVEANKIEAIIQKEQFYITPDEKGEKGYSIIFGALKALNIMAVGKIVMGGTKEYIATISVWRNMLLLTLLYYPKEVLVPPSVNMVDISERELELGKTLLQTLGAPDIKTLSNRYVKALQELIKAKAEGREIKPIEEVPQTPEDDIAAALENSLKGLGKRKKLGVAVAVDGEAALQEM